jgi:electron transfer flavoprotein alpha/beta subunit
MKIVVCIEPWGLSEASRAALALAAKLQAAEVTALAVTDGTASQPLEEAQRLGAARAAQVIETSLESFDAGVLGKTLAQALVRLEADLVLCGDRSDAEGRGIVPAAIAHHWKAPYVPLVEALAIAGREATVLVRSGGRKRTLALPLPAVLTVGASLTVPPPPVSEDPTSAIEIIRLDDPGDRTLNHASDLGTLDRPRRRPIAVTSAADLIKRWRE